MMTDGKLLVPDTPDNPSDEASLEENGKIESIPDEILEAIPEELRGGIRQAVSFVQREYFQGPLPPPTVLKGYEDVLPGSANRIVAMAEQQQQHRMEIEDAVIRSNIRMDQLGLGSAIVLALTLMVGGIWLTYEGKELTGLTLLVVDSVGLVGLFIWGQIQRQRGQQELDDRKKALEEGSSESDQHPSDVSET